MFVSASSTDRIQSRLLSLAALFLFLYSLTLTLSPAARAHTWEVEYRWDHWLGFLVWGAVFVAAHLLTSHRHPERDPYLLPVGALLTGWGMLSIWRLMPVFGQRQAVWLVLAAAVFLYFLRFPSDLGFLRRYKYVWLTGGLLLTALTLFMGINPSGDGLPRLWLGGFGLYMQPSEPLKLLLVVYLAAYLAGRSGQGGSVSLKISKSLLPLLAPTLIMTGLALLLLLFQKDLGTATIFLFLYAAVVYLASGRKNILLVSAGGILLSGVVGYMLFDVVRLRVDAWLNPWIDPSGRSYQIVQSLLAVANGGMIGRGPGLGSPSLVPVPHSDFIFTAITEETGLLGAIALLAILALLVVRGLRAALRAPDVFRRYLAAGLTAHLVGQSLLIIGGNLRLLPLTGVTLPFVSYGGSSLFTSLLSLAVLLQISSQPESEPAPLADPRPYRHLGLFLLAGLSAAALVAGWWAIYRGPDLLTRTDNPRRAIADRFVLRGSILDRRNEPLSTTLGAPGGYTRTSFYPDLGLVTGYTHPIYGQSALEASLDLILRGLEGYPELSVWENHLLYGQPPPGLDIRLTLDLSLQRVADDLLRGRQGSLVLINAGNGEILVMASHPNFDPNLLQENWAELVQDERAPLFNRATQGQYPAGPVIGPLLLAAALSPETPRKSIPPLVLDPSYPLDNAESLATVNCAYTPSSLTMEALIAAGCPRPAALLGQSLQNSSPNQERFPSSPIGVLLTNLGFYSAPAIQIPSASPLIPEGEVDPQRSIFDQAGLQISPLQLALAAASLSADGVRPAPRLVSAVKSPENTWVSVPASGEKMQVFDPTAARKAAKLLAFEQMPIWQVLATSSGAPGQAVTWYLAGSLPNGDGEPLTLALLLEENNPPVAAQIGQELIQAAME